jgi:hypothetical protein
MFFIFRCSSVMKMESVCSYDTSVSIYEYIWNNIPGDLYTEGDDSLTSIHKLKPQLQ